MAKDSGYYVKTEKGNIGYTIHNDKLVNGKIIVYLTENFKPCYDGDGKQKKILCLASELKIIGFKY